MTKNCKQTTVPTVDNSSSKCSEFGFTDFECVTTDFAIPYLSILAGSTLKDVIDSTVVDLKRKGSRIGILERAYKPTTVTTDDYTILSTDEIIYFAPTSLAGNATLPAVTVNNQGRKITFINFSGATKTLGTYRTGSATTDTTIVTDTQITLQAIGSEWILVAS